MSSVPRFQPISVRDYLDGESKAKRKHEYIEGFVYSMAGATNLHNRIATNATGSLYSLLRGNRCQVFNSDTKVRVRFSRGTRFYYPDASVVCQPNPAGDPFHDAPIVIVEIISESTRRTDEYEKREASIKAIENRTRKQKALRSVNKRRSEQQEQEDKRSRSC